MTGFAGRTARGLECNRCVLVFPFFALLPRVCSVFFMSPLSGRWIRVPAYFPARAFGFIVCRDAPIGCSLFKFCNSFWIGTAICTNLARLRRNNSPHSHPVADQAVKCVNPRSRPETRHPCGKHIRHPFVKSVAISSGKKARVYISGKSRAGMDKHGKTK
jgi:hypothetical protein